MYFLEVVKFIVNRVVIMCFVFNVMCVEIVGCIVLEMGCDLCLIGCLMYCMVIVVKVVGFLKDFLLIVLEEEVGYVFRDKIVYFCIGS